MVKLKLSGDDLTKVMLAGVNQIYGSIVETDFESVEIYNNHCAEFRAGVFAHVELENFGNNKVYTIKLVRDTLRCDLAKAKRIVESAPIRVLDCVPMGTAQSFLLKLRGLGAAGSLEEL